MKSKAIATKLVSHDVPNLQSLEHSKAYQLREKVNNGQKPNREEKNWLAEQVNRNAYFKKAIPLMGYRFSFEDVLKTFLVKQYGDWHEYNAPDKTSLRAMLYEKIDRIVEVSD